MEAKYHIDPKMDVPIYRQLSDEIAADIKNGKMSFGDRLPTVQELAQELFLAKGTVKRCYDELEILGLIEKVQGRGTFVKYKSTDRGSRKEAALAAIDEMLKTLEKLNISEAEANIFINLKLKERESVAPGVKVAVIASCPEIQISLSAAVRKIEGTDVFSFIADDVIAYPYKISEDADIIVTHEEIIDKIRAVVPDRSKLACVSLAPEPSCIAPMAKIEGEADVYSESPEFYECLESFCKRVFPGLFLKKHGFSDKKIKADANVLAPDEYERFCTAECAVDIEKHAPVKVAFLPDRGSMLQLNARIEQTLRGKSM